MNNHGPCCRCGGGDQGKQIVPILLQILLKVEKSKLRRLSVAMYGVRGMILLPLHTDNGFQRENLIFEIGGGG